MSRLFRVPRDILGELQREFPEVKNMETIIDRLFEMIFKKTIFDGACAITKLGVFFSFKTFSNRLGKIVPRFKFSMSRAMRKLLAEDAYMMDKIPDVRETSPRVELMESRGIRPGAEARKGAEKNRGVSREKTMERVAYDEIAEILGVVENDK